MCSKWEPAGHTPELVAARKEEPGHEQEREEAAKDDPLSDIDVEKFFED